jgi:tetratricopeptide (TPR) repeat protein
VLARAGALLSALREWEAAAKIIPAFVKMHESEPDAWRALARARYESGDVEGGKEASMRVLALDPKCALSHHNLALAALRAGDLAAASDLVKRGLTATRADEGLRRLRSRVLLARLRALLRRAGWRTESAP